MNTNPEPTPADVEAAANAICAEFQKTSRDKFLPIEVGRTYARAALTSLPSEREQIVAFIRAAIFYAKTKVGPELAESPVLKLVEQIADQIEAGAHLPTTEQEEG